MTSKKHEVSQKKISRKCAMGSSVTSGGGGVEVANFANVLKRGPWSPQEDALLIKYVKTWGEGHWKNVQRTGLMRCGKSCRLRWTNHLKPDLKKGPFTFEEEKIVIELHQKVGNRWSKIAAKLPGRTDNEVKNFWNTKIKKRIMHGSPETIEEGFSSTQQSELNETPPSLPSLNSPTSFFSPQNSNKNSSNSFINPQTKFSFSNKNTFILNFANEHRGQNNCSIHNLPFTPTSNVFHRPSINNPFPRSHVLEFATGSSYYNPNPFPFTNTHKYQNSFGHHLDDEVWTNGSLSFEHNIDLEVQEQYPENVEMTSIWVGVENDQVRFYDGTNYYYDGHSTTGITPKEESMKVEELEYMDDELSSLLNTFSFDESPPKLHLKSVGENATSSYSIHYYLDQKLAFPSFSGSTAGTALGSDSCDSMSSELDECIDAEDWINSP